MKQALAHPSKEKLPSVLIPLNNKVNQSKKAMEKTLAAYEKKAAEHEALCKKEADKIQVLRALAAMRIGKLTYKIKRTEYKLAKSELKLAKKAQNKLVPSTDQATSDVGKHEAKSTKKNKKAQTGLAKAADGAAPNSGKPSAKSKKGAATA